MSPTLPRLLYPPVYFSFYITVFLRVYIFVFSAFYIFAHSSDVLSHFCKLYPAHVSSLYIYFYVSFFYQTMLDSFREMRDKVILL